MNMRAARHCTAPRATRLPRGRKASATAIKLASAMASLATLAPNAPALPFWFKWVFRSSGPPVDVDVVIDGDGDGDDWSNYPEEQPIRGHAQLPKAGRLPVLSSVRRPCGRDCNYDS